MIRHGFTLVELLVVITIVVVLLALLSPALDRAVYAAELARCGAQIKTLGAALTTYAMDHRRHCIHRLGIDNGASWDVSILRPGLSTSVFTQQIELGDLRPQLKRYVSINKHLLDPFVRRVDLEASRDDSFTYGSYHIFAGWQYSTTVHFWSGQPSQGGPGMRKLGDRFTWAGRQYNSFVTDADHFNLDGWAMASHPDEPETLENRTFQDADLITGTTLAIPGGTNTTLSWFDHPPFWSGYPVRGNLDRNVGFDDGSVVRYDKVLPPLPGGIVQDPRMANVPWTQDGHGSGDWPRYGIQIPRQ